MRISDWSSDVCSSDLSGRSSDNFWKLSQFGSMRKFMSSLAQQITAAGLADHILSERQLGRLLGGGDARRYGLVNRALKDGSLLRVKRGTYLLGRDFRSLSEARLVGKEVVSTGRSRG